jgi:hypothetical protein
MSLVPSNDRPPWWTRWAVIASALDSTGRTVRLCIILLVLCVPTVLLLAMLKG